MAGSSDAGRRAVVAVAIIGLLAGGLLSPIVTGAAVAQQSQPETDNTVTRIEVTENGSAHWTVQIRTRLDTDQRVAEYAAFQDRFRNDTAQYLDPYRTRMRGVVANAANATDRRMQATAFTASTSIQEVPRRWGVVTYEFTWTNFAASENGQVTVGDVFQGGFFIADGDTLQVVTPDGYEVAHTDPAPDRRESGMVTWTGRQDFADGNPTVAIANTGQTDEGGAIAGTIVRIAVSGLLVVVLGLGGIVSYRRLTSDSDETPVPAEEAAERSESPPAAGEERDVEEREPVLTDEERVLDLLEANGGRIRQAVIAEECDWSASKTSRVVGELADEGVIEKLQLGRENLVSMPDEDE
ncbi:hypothetical protein Halru_0281 [Halovivax ruber XH-70]|uniref:Uncharacterized protein n=1 Tax=Halovivax ruber (strain DSM 18193 / JCM 13892 / XH-70) TaxID=797302 RepID=L0IAF5_HALRX|nr:winged helix-turn-helix transcriptional regulator [Halovivax ruber]AGB14927.1 hypothetical protein Halru_0281 [Halovivax ruber XH-70]